MGLVTNPTRLAIGSADGYVTFFNMAEEAKNKAGMAKN